MRNRGVDLCQTLARFALLGLIGGIASACSESTRLAGNPFSNPFASSAETSAEPRMTGSVAAPASAAPRQPVSSKPLSPPAAPTYNRPGPVASAPPPAPPKAQQSASGPAGWTTHGGTPVTLRAGDSLNSVATRYNVPASAILS